MTAHARKFTATLSLIALILLGVQTPVRAKVARISFEELTHNSDMIVLAHVEVVRAGSDGRKIAEADVLETWKGEPAKAIKFLASPTWICDIANAVEGERVILFLGEKPFLSSTRHIAHSGRGRMPIRDINGKEYATIWSGDVILPEGTPTVPGPKPEYSSFIRSVELSVLRDAVQKFLLESMPDPD